MELPISHHICLVMIPFMASLEPQRESQLTLVHLHNAHMLWRRLSLLFLPACFVSRACTANHRLIVQGGPASSVLGTRWDGTLLHRPFLQQFSVDYNHLQLQSPPLTGPNTCIPGQLIHLHNRCLIFSECSAYPSDALQWQNGCLTK